MITRHFEFLSHFCGKRKCSQLRLLPLLSGVSSVEGVLLMIISSASSHTEYAKLAENLRIDNWDHRKQMG
ncbi:Lysosomal Cobalamin Transport Escort Protein Lmbd1 [Manis pentadactyla]|nr:Lysosomal Cobalamin Transport Escort Protein Lmbd1 [Manis pentadactyla]